jgi:hypothetical protein
VTITRPEDRGKEPRLSSGDSVRLEEVERMAELKGQSSEAEDVKRMQFRIRSDTHNFPDSASVSRSGSGGQEFQPKAFSFFVLSML